MINARGEAGLGSEHPRSRQVLTTHTVDELILMKKSCNRDENPWIASLATREESPTRLKRKCV